MATEFIHFSESDIETTDPLQLEGVWIHDPEDPEGTIHHFRFGRNNKSGSIEVGGTEPSFAGRTFPVSDFGDHEKYSISVTVQVLSGPDYALERRIGRKFAKSKKPLY